MRVPVTGDVPDRLVDAIRDLATGGTNAVGNAFATLAPRATQTVVDDKLCTEVAMIALSPRTQSAATATVWVKQTAKGQFILGHDASAATDRNFDYEIRRR